MSRIKLEVNNLKINKWTLLSIALVVFGIAGAVNIFVHGEHAMGSSNAMPWGTLIAGYEYFVGISTGLLIVAAIGMIAKVQSIIPYTKVILMLAIFSLFGGFAILLVEEANPVNFIYYLITPNFTSPIWWMAPLYSLYLLLLFVLTVLVVREKHTLILPVSYFTAASALIALVCIGFLFGFVVARPYWNGPISPLYFVLTSIYSGVALGSIAVYLNRHEISKQPSPAFFLRRLYMTLLVTLSVIYIGKIFVGIFGHVPGKYEAVTALISGPLSFQFWVLEIAFAIALPAVLLFNSKKVSELRLAIAGASSLFGLFFMRFNMVIAGQIVPLKMMKNPEQEVVYNVFSIAWSEAALILGAFGIMTFLYLNRGLVEKIMKGKEVTDVTVPKNATR